MDKGIINILKSYGCGYMTDDYKEMIEEIDTFVKEREKAINVIQCCTQLPTIIEIDFDGHLKCQIETTDKSPTILKAVNG